MEQQYGAPVEFGSIRDLRASLALTLALIGPAASPVLAQRSNAMRYECRDAEPDSPASRRRAEEWVRDKLKAFVPAPEQALRMRAMEAEAERVKLVFYGINATCAQYLHGTMAQGEAEVSDKPCKSLDG